MSQSDGPAVSHRAARPAAGQKQGSGAVLTKVISGGQVGVDQAALRAARACGIGTGGFAPKGWLTEIGPAPWLKDYGLVEHSAPGYPPRTRANIEAAHATLILADVDDHSQLKGGTKLTFDIAFRAGSRGAGLFLADLRRPEMVADCREWLAECVGGRSAFTLNVAGPRESKAPGVGARAEAFLVKVFGDAEADQ